MRRIPRAWLVEEKATRYWLVRLLVKGGEVNKLIGNLISRQRRGSRKMR